MRNVIIASLGLEQQKRIQYVMDKRKGDCLILLHSIENKEDAETIEQEFKDRGKFDIELIPVNPYDYHEILRKTLDAAYNYPNDNIAFNPSLGTRIMSAALFFAANFLESKVYLVKEKDGEAVDVVDIYPIHRKKLTAPKKAILQSLVDVGDEGYPSIITLAHSVGKSRSSGTDHVQHLEKWGYVETSNSSPKQVQITLLGKTVLKLAERWKIGKEKT
ncbi:MAG: hypothetical protein GF411_20290 [Candidatus Lokiarchaeota archaeon]|nr:hypothetical protein [Candidatus Lokiarchaeota archaeon]